MNAYIWWWLKLPTSNIINTGGSIQKKGYAIAQFSKYIRPGYYRIDATYQPQPGVFVVAFKGAKNVIVVVNQNTSTKMQTFTFQNDTVQGVFRYTTSGSKNIKNDKTILCTGNSFRDTLDAQSITTFVSGCVPAPVKAYLQVNDGLLNTVNKITVKSGDSVKFAPISDYEGSWSWSGCGTTGSSNTQTIHPTDSCQSIVTFTNTCGAITTSAYTVTLRSTVGINSSVVNNDVKVYPNPTKNGSFKVTVPDYLIGSKIDITNMSGERIYQDAMTKQIMDINIGLTPGIYFLTIFEKGSSFSVKVVVE